MSKLIELLEHLDYQCLQGNTDIEIKDIVYDSRKISKDSLFICISGAKVDGHDFAKDAVNMGATCLVVEKDVDVPIDITVIKVKNTRYALALISAAYFNYPASKLKVIGITGTKGKTTTTHMIKSILENYQMILIQS